MNLYIYTGATDLTEAAVTAANNLTAVTEFPALVYGDTEPLAIRFTTDASGTQPSWANVAGHVVDVTVGELGSTGAERYAATSNFTYADNTYSGTIYLGTPGFANWVASRRNGKGWLDMQIRHTDTDGEIETLAVLTCPAWGSVPGIASPENTPVSYATYSDVLASQTAAAGSAATAAAAATGQFSSASLTGVVSVTAPTGSDLTLNGGSSGAVIKLSKAATGTVIITASASQNEGVVMDRAINGTDVFGHAIRDESTFTSANSGAYAAFDAAPVGLGSVNYNHMAGFQSRPEYGGSGTMQDLFGFNSLVEVSSGTVSNAIGLNVGDASGAGTVTTQYGVLITALTKGANNYAIWSSGANTPSYHAGNFEFGSGAKIFTDRVEARGAGTSLTLATNGGRTIKLQDGSSVFTHSAGTASVGITYNTFTGTNTATSGTVLFLEVKPTYNQASGTATNTDLLINRTQTAVGSGTQLLIDAQVGGVSKFSVDNVGAVAIGNAVTAGAAVASTHKVAINVGGTTYYFLVSNV